MSHWKSTPFPTPVVLVSRGKQSTVTETEWYENEIRGFDVGAGQSGWYYGESWWGIVARRVQGGWWSSTHRSNWVGLTHSLPILSVVFMLPNSCLLSSSPQPCPCHCSWCFSLGCCHFLCCHLLHLLSGTSIPIQLPYSFFSAYV